MIVILEHYLFSARVLAEIKGLAESAGLPEAIDPAEGGGVCVEGRWEFPSGSFEVEGGSSEPVPIAYRLTVSGKEVKAQAYWASWVVKGRKGEIPPPTPERTLGEMSRPTSTSGICFSEQMGDYPPPMDPVVHFREELISALEAELARLRAIEGD